MARPSRPATKRAATTKKKQASAPAKAARTVTKRTTATKNSPTKKAAATTTKRKATPTKATAATKTQAATRTPSKAPAKAPATKKKASASTDKFFEEQRAALLDERETYTRHATERRAEAEQLAADREPGDVQFDEESGQGDSMNVERERDLALSAQALAAVEEIEKALMRIDAGTYGICERCGNPIPRERLRALPHAALCVTCKSGGLTTRR